MQLAEHDVRAMQGRCWDRMLAQCLGSFVMSCRLVSESRDFHHEVSIVAGITHDQQGSGA